MLPCFCKNCGKYAQRYIQTSYLNLSGKKKSTFLRNSSKAKRLYSYIMTKIDEKNGSKSPLFFYQLLLSLKMSTLCLQRANHRKPAISSKPFTDFGLQLYIVKTSGSGCSKLTTSLVNDSLNFQKLISQICQYFLLKKCEKLLHCKSFSHFFNKKFQCIWS